MPSAPEPVSTATAEEITDNNARLGELVITSIPKIHGRMRPFILVLPPMMDEGGIQSITNITEPEIVTFLLKEHLKNIRDYGYQLEDFPKRKQH